MKTIKIKNIDGYNIVVGFGKLTVDPAKTNNMVIKEIKKSKTAKELMLLGREISFEKDQVKKKKKIKEAKKKRIRLHEEVMSAKNVICYFDPKKDEKIVSDKDYAELKLLYKKVSGQKMCISDKKEKIINLRGRGYFLKKENSIEHYTITTLGEDYPKDHVLALSYDEAKEFEKQIIEEHVKGLSQEELKEEYNMKKARNLFN